MVSFRRAALLAWTCGTVFHAAAAQCLNRKMAKDALKHLLKITKDASGNPNPRLTCTEGYYRAAKYVARQMRKIGMTMMGDTAGTTFLNVIPGSKDPTLCPGGITNLIGMVPGTKFPDEYVVFSAHLDGPNNQNPQTQTMRGNIGTSNAYDDGLAVAMGLAMAKDLMKNRPLRSIIFFFDDAEEGWRNVLIPNLGETNACDKIAGTEWYNTVVAATTDGTIWPCQNYPIGFQGWTKNPTVNLENIKAMFFADPMGAAPGSSPFMAAIGGDQTKYGQSGTMNDFLDEIWPQDTGISLLKTPRAALTANYGSIDAVTREYAGLCGSKCVASAGLPAVWLAQPAFQKYHGGFMINTVKGLFASLGIGNGSFPSPAYFSVDNLDAMDFSALDSTVVTLKSLLINAANSDEIKHLAFNKDRGGVIDNANIADAVVGSDALLDTVHKLPPSFSNALGPLVEDFQRNAEQLANMDLTNLQEEALEIITVIVSLFVAVDLFNPDYADKEAFLEQTYQNSIAEAVPSCNDFCADGKVWICRARFRRNFSAKDLAICKEDDSKSHKKGSGSESEEKLFQRSKCIKTDEVQDYMREGNNYCGKCIGEDY